LLFKANLRGDAIALNMYAGNSWDSSQLSSDVPGKF